MGGRGDARVFLVIALLSALCTYAAADLMSGELHVDVGMQFDPITHDIKGVSHHFHLKTDDGQDVSLEIPDKTEEEEFMKRGPGSRVEVNGSRNGKAFRGRVSDNDKAERSNRGDHKRQTGWQVSPRQTALGDMNVLFFLVNMQTTDTRYRWASAAQPAALAGTFDRLRADILRSSWGQLNLVSKKRDGTFGFYGLYETGVAPSCTSANVLQPIAAAVQTKFADDAWWNGYNGQTIHVFLWTPQMTTLCGSAWGTIGHPGGVWSELADYLMEHEFGHVIGHYHAGRATAATSFDTEYGDCSDVMGCLAQSSTPVNLVTGGSHNNAAHKVAVGWTRDQPVRERRLTSAISTSITIAPLSKATTTIPQVISMGSADAYGATFPGLPSHFLSLRVPDPSTGIEDNIPLEYYGVNIHQQTIGRSFYLGVLNTVGNYMEFVGRPDFYAEVVLTALSSTSATVKVTYFPLGGAMPPAVTTGLQFFPLPKPVRLVDTRSQTSVAVFAGPSAIVAGGTRAYFVGGFPGTGIPSSARAISSNIVAVGSTAGGYITVFPRGVGRPVSSSCNYAVGQTIACSSYPALGSDSGINVFVSSATNVIIDITGYFAPAASGGLWFKPLPAPVRMVDTRPGTSAVYVGPGAIAGAATLTKNFRAGGVGATAQAVSFTMAMLPQATNGYATVFQGGIAMPGTSSGNYQYPIALECAGITQVNPTDGTVSTYTTASLHVVTDVDGWFDGASGVGFIPLTTPLRLVDTRAGTTALFAGSGLIAAGTSRTFQLAGVTYNGVTIPASAVAVVGTVTVVHNGVKGYTRVYPVGTQPTSTQLQYDPALGAVALGLNMRVGTGGGVAIYSSAAANYIIDITGYYTDVAGVARAVGDASSGGSSSSVGTTTIVLIVIGTVVILAVAAALVAVLVVMRRRKLTRADQMEQLLKEGNSYEL